MKRTNIGVLIDNYENICNELLQKFITKQGIEFDGWIAEEVGTIACCSSQYFFNFEDIVHDLKTKQPKGLILDWLMDGTDYNMFREKTQYINYKSYTIGLRYSDLK